MLALLAACGPSGTGQPGEPPSGSVVEALQQCPSQSVEGVDVFDGQGSVEPIDWTALAAGGIGFAFIKATQGTYDTQATFARNWSGARAAGVRRGAYHFFDPTEEGTAQAQRFLAVVGPLAAGDLPPMLDIECPDGDSDCLGTGSAGAAGAASATDVARRMGDFLHTIEGATGTRPIVYTFASYFASNGVDPSGLEAYPLFLAQPSSGACIAVPAPWASATFWQYSWSGTASGVVGPVDRDRFLGSPAELEGLAIGPAADGGAGDLDAEAPKRDGGGAGVRPSLPGCF
jgi:lysozyme